MSYKEKIANLATVGLIITSILIFLFFLFDISNNLLNGTDKEQALHHNQTNLTSITEVESTEVN